MFTKIIFRFVNDYQILHSIDTEEVYHTIFTNEKERM